jgi:hypothetical protein
LFPKYERIFRKNELSGQSASTPCRRQWIAEAPPPFGQAMPAMTLLGTISIAQDYFPATGRIYMARKYSKKASKDVERVMKKRKAGTLKSGRSGKKVTSRKQAIAIGLSEARAEGKKVPKKASKKKSAKKRKAKK